jgi:hypothetical protein
MILGKIAYKNPSNLKFNHKPQENDKKTDTINLKNFENKGIKRGIFSNVRLNSLFFWT